ncbi:hypothetical protein [Thalassobaculum litoreum]|uniref:Uncharacterized protein n=1 Tax=Thalassobaculum litoreum DSM 18839 TaxID=1123362 RepID=A0A8G2EYX9_9PROT|nr:hypothetical protein [Thalassobaculum litoreum]SDF84382.1 hypothetical protein SAMN05660686_02508 [Thalassobaculum litoreum DSM 18839]
MADWRDSRPPLNQEEIDRLLALDEERDGDPISGWSFPNRSRRAPLFGFLWWRIDRAYRREFTEYLARRVRRAIGFQISDRIFIGIMIGDGETVSPTSRQMNEGGEQ